MNKQNCPLCKSDSKFNFIEGDGGKRKKYYCPKCKVFVITDTAERKLSTMTEEDRTKISALSVSLSDEHLLHIFVPPVASDMKLECLSELRAKWI